MIGCANCGNPLNDRRYKCHNQRRKMKRIKSSTLSRLGIKPIYFKIETGKDPKRIARICKKLVKVWKYGDTKDLRLGQFIGNLSGFIGVDSYYLEDDILESYLDERLKCMTLQKKGCRCFKVRRTK